MSSVVNDVMRFLQGDVTSSMKSGPARHPSQFLLFKILTLLSHSYAAVLLLNAAKIKLIICAIICRCLPME
jgi:hypothetical protein